MNRTQLYLPKTQLDTLRKVAKQKKSTVSAVVRYFVSQQLEIDTDKNSKKNSHVSLFAMSQKINLFGAKAPINLSKNIDSYIYGRN